MNLLKRFGNIAIMFVMLIMMKFIPVYGQENMELKVYTDGNEITFDDMKPYLNNNSEVMVPFRFILENMGYKVLWDESLNAPIINHEDLGTKTINNSRGVIVNQSLYMPIRVLMDDLGYSVDYKQDENGIEIHTDKSQVYKALGSKKVSIKKHMYVAHGGGIINEDRITNSLEALNNSVEKGLKMIEVDFSMSTDGIPVLMHDWSFGYKFFGVSAIPYTYERFTNELVMYNGLHQLGIEEAMNWLRDHTDIYFITDTKYDNIALLAYISDNYPDLLNRIIPQIYSQSEYEPVKQMGYNNIILTVYKMNNSVQEIVEMAIANEYFAVAMPVERVKAGLAQELNKYGIFSYCHTINDLNTVNTLIKLGAGGFYTDSLY